MDQAEHDPTGLDATIADRGIKYGVFLDRAKAVQELKKVAERHMNEKGRQMMADQKEALDMIFHKISRIICGDPDHADSWHDIAGYAKLVENRLNGKSERVAAQKFILTNAWRNDRWPTERDADSLKNIWVWDNRLNMALKVYWGDCGNYPWINGNAPRPTCPPAKG